MKLSINLPSSMSIEELKEGFPLVYESAMILSERGRPGFDEWEAALLPEQRDEVARQLIELLSHITGLDMETIARAILSGKLRL